MITMLKLSLTAVLSVASFVMLAEAAPTPVVATDFFSDNSINPNVWLKRYFGGMTVTETNQRLQFRSNRTTNVISYAGLEVKNWGARWNYDFEIDLKFKLGLISLNSNQQVVEGIWLAHSGRYPSNLTGYAVGVFRDDVGIKLAMARYQNGQVTNSQATPISVNSGQIRLNYDRETDRLTAKVGTKTVSLNGIWALNGAEFGLNPLVISIGCGTKGGNVFFTGAQAYVDEFRFEGVKRAR